MSKWMQQLIKYQVEMCKKEDQLIEYLQEKFVGLDRDTLLDAIRDYSSKSMNPAYITLDAIRNYANQWNKTGHEFITYLANR